MPRLSHRLARLEQQMAVQAGCGMQIVVRALARHLVLDDDECLKVLDEFGFVQHDRISVADLTQIPEGLSVNELKQYLRVHGAEICGPTRVQPC